MKVRVFTHSELPGSRLTGGGKHWVEDMTMERLAKLAGIPGCLVQVQPSMDNPASENQLWVTVCGANSKVTAEIEDGGDPGWGS